MLEAERDAGLEIDFHLGSEIAFRFNMPEVSAWPSGHLAEEAYVLTELAGVARLFLDNPICVLRGESRRDARGERRIFSSAC